MILQGDIVSLRPMEPEEVNLIHTWANNPVRGIGGKINGETNARHLF
jgi:hypothetical protein